MVLKSFSFITIQIFLSLCYSQLLLFLISRVNLTKKALQDKVVLLICQFLKHFFEMFRFPVCFLHLYPAPHIPFIHEGVGSLSVSDLCHLHPPRKLNLNGDPKMHWYFLPLIMWYLFQRKGKLMKFIYIIFQQ